MIDVSSFYQSGIPRSEKCTMQIIESAKPRARQPRAMQKHAIGGIGLELLLSNLLGRCLVLSKQHSTIHIPNADHMPQVGSPALLYMCQWQSRVRFVKNGKVTATPCPMLRRKLTLHTS